jgi:endoglucanase
MRNNPLPIVCLTLASFALLFPLPLRAQTTHPDTTKALLRQLANAPGPSGAEGPVRAIMVQHMKPYVTAPIRYGGMGSVIAQQGSTGPRVMIDAHMDELGGMVRRITPHGFLTMQMLGGWLDQALVDQRWVILGSRGPVEAVTGIRDIHVLPAAERSKVFPRNMLRLDIGASSAAQVAAMGIEPGDPIVPDSPFVQLNGTDNYLAKAWDDRVGCAVLIEAMKRTAKLTHHNQLFFVATTQEEVGLRGARAAAQIVKPDIGIAIEGGVAGDTYPGHPEETQAKLGAGPGLFLYDYDEMPNRKFVQFVKATAAKYSIPLQFDLVQGYGDDSAEIQESNGGTPTINLVAPIRYTHAHNGILNRQDFDHLVDLVTDLLVSLDQQQVDHIRNFAPGQ